MPTSAPMTPATSEPRASTRGATGVVTLTLTGSGTAMASVCAVGLLQMQQLAGGIWSVLAVLIAGALCSVIALALGRLSSVVPSGAGLLAYFSRGLDRRAATLLMMSYLFVMLLLVGVEALIVGVLVAELLPVPVLAGALGFLAATWLVCLRGIHIGYRSQSIATVALFACMTALSIVAVASAIARGDLAARMWTAAPSATAMITAIGQAIFLLMGFELVTSHAEVAAPRAVGRALRLSVAVLVVFYGVIALGLASLTTLPTIDATHLIVPQIALAAEAGHRVVLIFVIAVCLLASFTSFNGALLGISLFSRALARQGVLPRVLSGVDPRTLVARPALRALFVVTAGFTLVIHSLALYQAAILSAAIVTAAVYGAVLWTRERPPFREPIRRRALARTSLVVALGFGGLGIGVFVDAGAARTTVAALLLVIVGVAVCAALRIRAPRPDPRAVNGRTS